MTKTPKKPAPGSSTTKPPAGRKTAAPNSLNPRQKPDLRWQRAKRYNWDGR